MAALHDFKKKQKVIFDFDATRQVEGVIVNFEECKGYKGSRYDAAHIECEFDGKKRTIRVPIWRLTAKE